jgi:integrase-like protein
MRLERARVTLAVHVPPDGQTTQLGPGAEPQFSPGGKWLAFVEPGGAGIGIRPFPGPGPRLQISSGPAAQPRWSRDGAQLFYITADKKLTAVSFDAETGRAGAPRHLFQTRIIGASLIGFQYDVASDGRFLIHSLPAGAGANVLQQQARFDAFVEQYNQERPHQALGMKVPADVYVRSPRVYRGLDELTYPFHDATLTVTHCGRICFKGRKVNLSQVFAGQNVGVTQVGDRIWLVTFMQYDLGYFDDETCRLEPIENPFGPKVLPMCSAE